MSVALPALLCDAARLTDVEFDYLVAALSLQVAGDLARKHGNWTPKRAEALSCKLLRDAVMRLRFDEDRTTALSNIREAKAISKAGRKKFFGELPMWAKTAIALLGYEFGIQVMVLAVKHLRRKPTRV